MGRRGFPRGDGTFTRHKQVPVRVGEWEADVDAGLAPLIVEIWRAGWPTVRSCQWHGPSGKVWVEFADALDAAAFLSAAGAGNADVIDRQQWCFADFRRRSEHLMDDAATWELHTHVERDEDGVCRIAVSVLFPRRDLRTAFTAMQVYNSIG